MSSVTTNSATFVIPALDCPEELALIRTGLSSCRGIVSLEPNFLQRSLAVEFDPNQIAAKAIADRLNAIGFPPNKAEPTNADLTPQVTERERIRPLRITTSLGGLLLGLAIGVQLFASHTICLPLLSLASALLSGWSVGRGAWRAVRLWRLDMNSLMVIAAIGALASAPQTGEWTEAPTAMFLFGVSLWLESYSLGKARNAVRALVELSPTIAHRLEKANCCHHDHDTPATHSERPAEVLDVSPESLRVGDRLLIRPGERVPVDGKILSGNSALNEAAITGESMPVEKAGGDLVFAGSINGEGSLEIHVTQLARESTLAHIARLVEQAHAARSSTERFVDSFARRYTPAVILLAIVIAFVPPLAVHWGIIANNALANDRWFDWLHRGLVLLVIACPCALVISTPITIVCGLRRATNLGLLVKGGEYLELAGRIDAVAFDKTGTLTEARPQVVEVRSAGKATTDEILMIAASLETRSEHPLARAIVQAAVDRGLTLQKVERFRVERGAGVHGEIQGEEFIVASRRFFANGRVTTTEWEDAENVTSNADDHVRVSVGTPQAVWGEILLSDEPRVDAAKMVAELKAMQVSPLVMLTGDSRSVAGKVAAQTGITQFESELLPVDKLEHIKKLASLHPFLAMVGDGVNDAPALAAARVGIAFGPQASATALESADIVVLTPQLRRIPELIRLGRRTRSLLLQNIVLAIGIKVLVLVLAIFGRANLWLAVGADVGASLLVIFNGMRLLK